MYDKEASATRSIYDKEAFRPKKTGRDQSGKELPRRRRCPNPNQNKAQATRCFSSSSRRHGSEPAPTATLLSGALSGPRSGRDRLALNTPASGREGSGWRTHRPPLLKAFAAMDGTALCGLE